MHPPTQTHYAQHASQYAREYLAANVTALHGILEKWLPIGGKVLEIGCGVGRDAAFMTSLGYRVVATDASSEMLRFSEEYLRKNSQSDKYTLTQACFPVEPDHKLLAERFDAVVCLATIMHIPDSELFTFAFQIKSLLNSKGIFICSFCPGRETSEEDPRLFVNREPSQIQLFFERIGFRLLYAAESKDGLGRDIQWTTLVFESEGTLGFRPVDQIEAIINRDKKVATYKLALVRALSDISQTEYRNAKWHTDHLVSIPLGLIAEKWIYYYWPLIESEILLPQMNGFERNRKIAFRTQLSLLIAAFRGKGGLSAFHAAWRAGRLDPQSHHLLLECIKAISVAIVKGPVNYSGGSVDGLDQIFTYYGILKVNQIKTREDVSAKLGRVFFDASIWREMSLMGHWIGEAIILRWAELVHQFSNKNIPVASIVAELLVTPELSRDVAVAKSIFQNLETLHCVYTNKSLSGSRFDVDHLIPFSLWHNNDLWNLLPADQKVNNNKRDKIIRQETLQKCEERIVYYWRIQNKAQPERFQNEISRTLLGTRLPSGNWEKPVLSALSEAIEMVAIQRGVERWGEL